MKIIIKIHPNSSQEKIIQKQDNSFDIYTQAPPIDNKANEALIKILSKYFDVAPSMIEIKKGHKSKIKIIEVNI